MTHEWFRLGRQSAHIVLVLVVAGCSGRLPQNQNPPQSQRAISPQECLSEQTNSPCFYWRETSSKKNEKLVIFVHGVFSNPSDTWGDVKMGNAWPLLARGDDNFKDFDIYLFNYHTTYFTSAQKIHEIAIREMQSLKDSDEFAQYKEIYFIAHSMGGLIVKSLLTHLNRGDDVALLRRVKAVVYLGTPAQGVNLAVLGSLLSFNPQVREMEPASQNSWLSDLEIHWIQLMGDRKDSPYPRAFCAYETLPYRGILIVPKEAAASVCDDPPVGFPFDHSDLAVPTTRNHDPYVWVMEKILKTSRDVTRQNNFTAPVPIEPEEMPIYIECEGKPFPETIPSDGKLKGLVFFHRTPVSSSTSTEFQSIGMPGSRTDWADSRGKNVLECQVTNYGTVPVLKIQITFGLRFKDTIWLNSQGSFVFGPTKVSEGWASQIRKLDPWPAERFVFYMKNATNDWLEVSMPEFVEL